MKVGDVVSEALDFGIPWEEAERNDQTQKGVIFKIHPITLIRKKSETTYKINLNLSPT